MYFRCYHCKFEVPEDDIWLLLPENRCICLKCAMRLADDKHEMSKELRQQVYAVLAAIAGG